MCLEKSEDIQPSENEIRAGRTVRGYGKTRMIRVVRGEIVQIRTDEEGNISQVFVQRSKDIPAVRLFR